MSIFYRLAYRIGFTPWEEGLAQHRVVEQISALFDREEVGRRPPYGRVLDLGCGSGIHAVNLAARGWQVTGIDSVPKALDRARKRARKAGVDVRFRHGDVTALRAAGVGSDFRLVMDFGTLHGLPQAQRETVGREVSAIATADATILMIAFAPGRRGPLPRGASRADIEAIYPGWTITDVIAPNARPPWFLELVGADPHWYRLCRR